MIPDSRAYREPGFLEIQKKSYGGSRGSGNTEKEFAPEHDGLFRLTDFELWLKAADVKQNISKLQAESDLEEMEVRKQIEARRNEAQAKKKAQAEAHARGVFTVFLSEPGLLEKPIDVLVQEELAKRHGFLFGSNLHQLCRTLSEIEQEIARRQREKERREVDQEKNRKARRKTIVIAMALLFTGLAVGALILIALT
jgi:hypothetical protein